MTKLSVTKSETVSRMVDSLIDKANLEDVSLSGINRENFNSFLDEAFNDGGQVRCESFCDLAWDYSGQFGQLESRPFGEAQWRCIQSALSLLEKRFPATNKVA